MAGLLRIGSALELDLHLSNRALSTSVAVASERANAVKQTALEYHFSRGVVGPLGGTVVVGGQCELVSKG